MKAINTEKVLFKAFHIPTPETPLKIDIFHHTIVKWINSCETVEQLDAILPFTAKYRFMQQEKGWDMMKSVGLIQLINLKFKIIMNEKRLEVENKRLSLLNEMLETNKKLMILKKYIN
jgi:hypothetical protein